MARTFQVTGGTLLAVLLFFAGSLSADGHVGNPYVFFEGNAGPYQVRVSIQPPEVVPGRAQINVRVHNGLPQRLSDFLPPWYGVC